MQLENESQSAYEKVMNLFIESKKSAENGLIGKLNSTTVEDYQIFIDLVKTVGKNYINPEQYETLYFHNEELAILIGDNEVLEIRHGFEEMMTTKYTRDYESHIKRFGSTIYTGFPTLSGLRIKYKDGEIKLSSAEALDSKIFENIVSKYFN